MSNFLRDDGIFAAIPAGVTGPTSTVINDFASFATTDGQTLGDLSHAAATASLTVFSSAAQGVAPSSPGGTSAFLRSDASWATPPNNSGTVNGPTPTVSADAATFNSSVGTTLADISWTTFTSRLTQVTSAAQGLPSASGGGAVHFLRSDNTWQTPTIQGLSSILDANLPAAISNRGAMYLVTDMTSSLGLAYYQVNPGSGVQQRVIPVFSDGSKWRLG